MPPHWFFTTIILLKTRPKTLQSHLGAGEAVEVEEVAVAVAVGDRLLHLRLNFCSGISCTRSSEVSLPSLVSPLKNSKVNVNLTLLNDLQSYPSIEIVENVQKEVANSTDYINFIDPPSLMIKKDPIFEWDFANVQPFETKTISYSINNILDTFSSYI